VSTPRDESPSSTPPDLKILRHADKDEPLGCISHETFHYLRPDGSAFPATECPLLLPRLTGGTVRVDLDWSVRKDTTHVAVSYSSAPVDLTDGRGAVVAFRDISDRLRLRELETSRARIVQAADEARRRIERDLHDGAQQQFVAVAMRLETPGACSRSRPMTPRGSSGPRTPTSAKPSQNSSA
jgi:signal transduction histidine kinase